MNTQTQNANTDDSKIRRYKFLLIVLSALLVAGILSYVYVENRITGYASSEEEITEITMGTFSKSIGNAPYYIAKNFGWFESDPAFKGTKFNYVEFNDRPAISDAFARGELQVLFSGEIPSMLIKAQGNDIKLSYVSALLRQEILVPNGSEIKNVKELKGKTLAVQAGTSAQYCVLKILSENNLPQADLNIMYITAAEAKPAFEMGKLDAWAVWAPWVEQQQVSGKGVSIEGAQICNLVNVMTLSEKIVKKDSEKTKSLIKIISRAKKWIADNPIEAQQIVATQLGLDIKVIETAWPKFDYSATLNDEILNDFEKKAQFLAEQNLTRESKSVDMAEYIYK